MEVGIRSGLGFFDHMLEQIGRHGMMDLNISCKGDLNVDEHHTLQDIECRFLPEETHATTD